MLQRVLRGTVHLCQHISCRRASILSVFQRPGRSQRLKANRIDGFDNRALRAFEGIKWFHHVTKETFRAGTQQAPASSLAVMHRIRWLGHVLRLLPEHPTRTELNFDPRETERRRPEDPPAPAASTSLKKTLGQAPCMGQAWMEKSGLPVWLYTLTSARNNKCMDKISFCVLPS